MSSSPRRHRSRQLLPLGFILLVLVVLLGAVYVVPSYLPTGLPVRSWSSATDREPAWPPTGQAAIWVPGHGVLASAKDSAAVPIASVAKVMTALIVLDEAPLPPGEDGFQLAVTRADVRATERSRQRDESVVEVEPGEVLSEREALLALMLPSANNVAHLLAEEVAGSQPAFVTLMNQRSRRLGLLDTTYADASGFDVRTTSTAQDQLTLARVALKNPTFAWLVRQRSAVIPVAGRIRTTDRLLGHDGYVGVKTGSHTAAGGCLVFAVHRSVEGRDQLLVGVVLGQPGDDLIEAALRSTERLTDSIAPVS